MSRRITEMLHAMINFHMKDYANYLEFTLYV